jgi:hypothetical protein
VSITKLHLWKCLSSSLVANEEIMHTIDKPKIVVFHPYMEVPGTPAASAHLTYRGQTGTISVIWHAAAPDGTPTDPELRVHDELTPGGHSTTGAAGTAGTSGIDGIDGLPGASAYQLAVANGFVGSVASWFTSLVGPTGAGGPAGVDGVDGATGDIPVPVWVGTALGWADQNGMTLATPVDLAGPAGAGGTNAWVSNHPTLTGVQTLHIIPAGAPAGTPAQTYNIGMDELDDFEFEPALGRLRITTKAGNEYEVDIGVTGTTVTGDAVPAGGTVGQVLTAGAGSTRSWQTPTGQFFSQAAVPTTATQGALWWNTGSEILFCLAAPGLWVQAGPDGTGALAGTEFYSQPTVPVGATQGAFWWVTATETLLCLVNQAANLWVQVGPDGATPTPTLTHYAQATPPTAPQPGDTWHSTTSDLVFIRVANGANPTWLQIS